MKRLRRIGLALLAACLPIPEGAGAAAPQWSEAPPSQARPLALGVAKCVVALRRTETLAALGMPFGDAASRTRLGSLFAPECLNRLIERNIPTEPSQLGMAPLLARGLLFEALYAKDFGRSATIASFGTVPGVGYPAAALDGPDPLGRDYRALMRIGDCAVRAAPQEARQLLRTKVASGEEGRAISALDGAWSRCLPAAGKKLVFTPEVVRGTIAEPLYRLTQSRQRSEGTR
jgi:hypothetical protein